MQLVDSDRDNATVWIARGAPRRWYADDGATTVLADTAGHAHTASHGTGAAPAVMFSAAFAPSRWGVVGFTMGAQLVQGVVGAGADVSGGVGEVTTSVALSIDFTQPIGAIQHTPTLMVKIRDPTDTKVLSSAIVRCSFSLIQFCSCSARRCYRVAPIRIMVASH
jgi:hypothetical protein